MGLMFSNRSDVWQVSWQQNFRGGYQILERYNNYPTHAHEFQGFRVWGKFVFRTLESTDTPTKHQCGQSEQSWSHSWPITQCPVAWTCESEPKQCAVMAIVEDGSPHFDTVLRGLNGCMCFLSVGWKQNPYFEWVLWHRSSLCQMSLEHTWPNGLVGCRVPTDIVKIGVKEAMHIGFYYIWWHEVLWLSE